MQMSHLAAGALGGLLGAVVGAFLTLTLSVDEAIVERDPAPRTAELELAFRSALEETLAPLETEMRRVRSSLAQRGAISGESATVASDAPSPRPRIGDAATASQPQQTTRPADADWLPDANYERLKELRGFDEVQEVRRRWAFTSDRDALRWFGTPHEIWTGEGGGESWHYEFEDGVDEDGDPVTVEFHLSFVRGRLLQVSADE